MQQGVNRKLRMVNAISDKKLFNSMEIDRKTKYQSLRFPKSSSQTRTVSSWKQAKKIIFLCGRRISLTELRKDFTIRNIFSSEQKPCIVTMRLVDSFSRPLESAYSQWRPFSELFYYLRLPWTKWSPWWHWIWYGFEIETT